MKCPIPAMRNCKRQTQELMNVSYLAATLKAESVFNASGAKTKENITRLTSDNQLGRDSDIVDGRLCCAGVAAGVLQLDILDEQAAI